MPRLVQSQRSLRIPVPLREAIRLAAEEAGMTDESEWMRHAFREKLHRDKMLDSFERLEARVVPGLKALGQAQQANIAMLDMFIRLFLTHVPPASDLAKARSQAVSRYADFQKAVSTVFAGDLAAITNGRAKPVTKSLEGDLE